MPQKSAIGMISRVSILMNVEYSYLIRWYWRVMDARAVEDVVREDADDDAQLDVDVEVGLRVRVLDAELLEDALV